MPKYRYIQLEGPLFEKVQTARVFRDSKTFVDTVPLGSAESVMDMYEREHTKPGFNISDFIRAHFWIPPHDRDRKSVV